MKRFLFCFAMLFVSTISGAPADFDLTFGTNGYSLLNAGSGQEFLSVALDSNDNIVAIGYVNGEVFVARYDSSGNLDTAGFASPTGYASFNDHIDNIRFGDVDSSDNVLVAGQKHGDSSKCRVIKIKSDGTGLDTSGFGGGNGYFDFTVNGTDVVTVMHAILDASDRLVIVGYYTSSGRYIPFVARVLADGSALDTGFNGTGLIKETSFAGGSNDAVWENVAIDGSNRIVVVGYAGTQPSGGDDVAIARYSDTGTVESGFGNTNSIVGTGGIQIEDLSPDSDLDRGFAVGITSGDNIVVAGPVNDFGSHKTAIVQFDATDGSLDTSFNGTGKHIFQINSERLRVDSLVIDSDGRITLVGYLIVSDHEAMARFNSDGTLDDNFGSAGLIYDFYGPSNIDVNAAVLQSDGKLVIVGDVEGGSEELFIARVMGSIIETDTTFGTDGFLTTVSGSAADKQPELRRLFVASDNKMFIVEQNQETSPEVVLHKLNEDGTAIVVNFPVTITGESNPADIIEDADGKILIVGGQAGEWMYRYNADGTLDATFNNGVTPGYRSSATDKQFGASGRGEHVVQQSNGRYLVVGSDGTDGKILAIANDGTVDSSFGSSGIYTLSGADIDDVVVSDLNEIFIAYEGGTNIEIAKIKNDGSGLDTSYGTSGVYDTGLAKATYTNVSKIALDSSGKVVLVNVNSSTKDIVCYRATTGGGADANGTFTAVAHGVTAPIISKMQATESDQVVIAGYESGAVGHFVARLNSSLAVDTGFGTGGIKKFAYQWGDSLGVVHDLEVSPSGNIIVVGYEDDGASNYTDFVARLTGDTNIGQVVRFPNVDTVGNVDLFFGVNGELDLNGTASLGNGDSKSMHILSGGEILLAVQNSDGSTTDLVKLDASYAADGTFNGGSRVQFATSADLRYVDADAAGNILLCGGDGTSGSDAAWLHKVQSDGSAHATFVSPTDVIDKAYKVVEQSSGRLIVAGIEDSVATLIAYSPVTGDVDTSFGTNGRYTVAGISNPIVDIAVDTATDQLLIAYMDGSNNAQVKKLMPNAKAEVSGFSFGTAIGSVAASDQIKMRILNSGKIAVVTRNGASFRMSRYLATGGTDVSEVTVSSIGLNNLRDVIALSDGKLIVVGETSSNGVVIARMDGSLALDTTFNPTAGFLSTGLAVMTDFMAVDIESDGNILIAGASA